MAIEVAMEDDVFFADLNRRISLLIDDDDGEDPLSHFPSISPQVTRNHPSMLAAAAGTQYLYEENCAREYLISSKGTGVFIPQRPQLRRKYRDQRKRSNKSNNNNNNNNNNKHFISSKGRPNATNYFN